MKTTSAEALLGLLSHGPATGYELRSRIEGSIGNFWSESFGQIYPSLRRLEEDGLAVSRQEGKGSKTVYSITDAGRERLASWLEIAPRPRIPRNELLLKLFFGGLASGTSLRSHVMETRDRTEADLKRYVEIERTIIEKHGQHPDLPYWLMTVRYGVAEARAKARWCYQTLAELDRLEERSSNVRIEEVAHAS